MLHKSVYQMVPVVPRCRGHCNTTVKHALRAVLGTRATYVVRARPISIVVAIPRTVREEGGHERELNNRSAIRGTDGVPQKVYISPVVRPVANYDPNIVVEKAVLPHPTQSKFARGTLELLLPIFSESQCCVPASKGILPDVIER